MAGHSHAPIAPMGRPPISSMDGLASMMAQGAASNRQSDLSAMFAMLQQQEGSAARAAAATERHSNQLAMMAMFSAAIDRK